MSRTCNRHSRIPLAVTLLTLIFMYTPLIMVGIASFNASRFSGKWEGFSFIWYQRLFENSKIWMALCNTLVIAVIAVFAVILNSAFGLFWSNETTEGRPMSDLVRSIKQN